MGAWADFIMGLVFSPEEDGYSNTLSCSSDFKVIGEIEGEAVGTMLRVVLSLVTVSLVSSWWRKKKTMGRLLLFFSHWLR